MDKEQDQEKEQEINEQEEMDWDAFFSDEEDEAWEREKEKKKKRKSRVVKIISSLIAFTLLISGLQVWFGFFNIPAFRFIEVSQRLSALPEVAEYKESVVTIEWDGKKGTGFNIDPSGMIVTNEHVVDHTNQVRVHFHNGESFIGKVVKSEESLDLAIVEIEAENLPYLPVTYERDWEQWNGEPIIFIGNPLAFNRIANEGTITGSTMVQSVRVPVMIIEAPIYKGNSGSPVINEQGEVIGIIFATISAPETNGRVGVATPSYYLQELLEEVPF